MHPVHVKFAKQFVMYATVPLSGYIIGKYLDDKETDRMTRFRDKSALYGRELGPDGKPSWPRWVAGY